MKLWCFLDIWYLNSQLYIHFFFALLVAFLLSWEMFFLKVHLPTSKDGSESLGSPISHDVVPLENNGLQCLCQVLVGQGQFADEGVPRQGVIAPDKDVQREAIARCVLPTDLFFVYVSFMNPGHDALPSVSIKAKFRAFYRYSLESKNFACIEDIFLQLSRRERKIFGSTDSKDRYNKEIFSFSA